jgi:hypothetical protein
MLVSPIQEWMIWISKYFGAVSYVLTRLNDICIKSAVLDVVVPYIYAMWIV